MVIALRIILGFIVTVFFVGIIFSTFFTLPKYLSIPEVSLSAEFSDIEGIFSHSTSYFNSFYSSRESSPHIVNSTGGVYDVDMNVPGKFISSFRDMEKKYSFSATGFLVKQEGIGEIFFDTLSTPGKVFIYAVNTPLTLSLLNNEGTEEYVDIHLTPHMYIEFQANRGKYLKNADRIRISTVFKLGYIGALGTYGKGEEYVKKYIEPEDDFLGKVISNINMNDIRLQKLLTDFSTQSVSQIPGHDSIQRYIHFFINDEKKIVFYKNKVLEGYLKILKIQSMDTKILLQTKKDLEVLKSLDIGAHMELIQLQNKLSKALYASNKEEFIIPKLLFASFLESSIVRDQWYFPLYAFSLFSSYDRDYIFSYGLSRKFLQSFPIYMKNINISNAQIELRQDYFLYYLEKQLLYLLNIEQSSQNITSVIITLENYVNITLRNDDSSRTARVTRLFVFSNILGKIDSFLRSEYFLSERSKDGILELHFQNKISVQDTIKIKKHVNALYKIYDKDKEYLNDTNSRDIGIMEDIVTSRSKIEEYFSALENYETYKTLYDVSKINLLGLGTFSSGANDILLIDKMRTYLSQFIGISSLDTIITIENGLYYHVEKLSISGKVFDFDIYPSPEYKITNIYIDEVAKPIQYKLGNIQDDWNEKYKTAAQEQRSQYDFSKFFLLTFFKKNDPSIEEYITTTSVQEDKTEIVFKKDILLGNPGEFTVLKNFLSIEYRDITLEKENQDYNIFLNNVDFHILIPEKSGGNKIYKGILKSQYILNNTDHYFKGLSFQIYKKHDDPDKDILFDGKSIFVGGKIHIADMKKISESLISHTTFYNHIYSELQNIGGLDNAVLQYTIFNDKLSIKFDSGGKKYTILLRDGKIESIYKGISKVASGNILLIDIKNYIQ